jgi:hypothetical protein
MTVKPLPGVTGRQLLDFLSERLELLRSIGGMTTTGSELQWHYLHWVSKTAELLRQRVNQADLQWLIAPESAWRLASLTPDHWSRHLLGGLARFEVETRIDLFTAARDELQVHVDRWTDAAGQLIVPDSSLFIKHPQKLEEMMLSDDFPELEVPLCLILPIIVVDELDGLKQSSNKHVRWRAGHTLAVLDRLLTDGKGPAPVRHADSSSIDEGKSSRGQVTVEVMFDPPDHRRLPINDDEIIDRALAIQRLAGRNVTLVTYDTGQSMRARVAGLTAVKLRTPDEEQPKQ